MPYTWTDQDQTTELQLWPHQSLPPAGLAAVVLGAFTFSTIPLYGLLGTKLLWGLLPFMLAAVGGMWFALTRNGRDRQVLETLRMDPAEMHLVRRNPKGDTQEWACNTYWAKVELHEDGGPVPYYVTLTGGGRAVEIGAFLSEDERKTLYDDLDRRVRRMAAR